MCASEKQIHIITRIPEQFEDLHRVFELGDASRDVLRDALQGVVVKEDLSDRTIQDFQNCCAVFDDMLDSNQKLIDPFLTRGRHKNLDIYYLSQSYFNLPKRTIRNNSNMITLFQQTLKNIEHIYRDIAVFDVV